VVPVVLVPVDVVPVDVVPVDVVRRPDCCRSSRWCGRGDGCGRPRRLPFERLETRERSRALASTGITALALAFVVARRVAISFERSGIHGISVGERAAPPVAGSCEGR